MKSSRKYLPHIVKSMGLWIVYEGEINVRTDLFELASQWTLKKNTEQNFLARKERARLCTEPHQLKQMK